MAYATKAGRREFRPDPNCPYNHIKHYKGYDFGDPEVYAEQAKVNREACERLAEVITFADRPVPGKVTICHAGTKYGRRCYRILSNPIRLDNDLIALFADAGNLCFGYLVEGTLISVFTD